MKKRGTTICLILIMVLLFFTTAHCKETYEIKVQTDTDSKSSSYMRHIIYLANKNQENQIEYNRFYSGYTSININGSIYIYGQGEEIIAPYINEEGAMISSQKFQDIIITEEITTKENQVSGNSLEVNYQLSNNGKEQTVGIRYMSDFITGSEDLAQIYIDDILINKEELYDDENVPERFKIMLEDGQIINCSISHKSLKENQLCFAQWDSIYESRWDYEVNPGIEISDTSAAFVWKELLLKEEEKIICGIRFSTEMGISITQYDETFTQSNDNLNKISSGASNGSSILTGDKRQLEIIFILATVSVIAVVIIIRKKK